MECIVACDNCEQEYKISPEKMPYEETSFTCKKCGERVELVKSQLFEKIEQGEKAEWLKDDLGVAAPASERPSSSKNFFSQSEKMSDRASRPLVPESPEKKTWRFGLTMKVVVLMLLVSLIPGGLYFAFSFMQLDEQITRSLDNNAAVASGLLSEGVDEWINENVKALRMVADTLGENTLSKEQQIELLQTLQKEYNWMYLVFATDIRGINLVRSDGAALKDYSNRQYIKDIINGAELSWQNLIGKTSKKPTMVLAVPFHRDGVVAGVVAAAMTREVLSEVLSDIVAAFSLGKTGNSFLVDEKGTVIVHKNKSWVQREYDLSQHPLVSSSSTEMKPIEFTDSTGKEMVGFSRKTSLGWVICLQQEKREAFEPLQKARTLALIVLVITFFVVLIIAFLAGRSLTIPICKLTAAADRISVGDLEMEIIRGSNDEIGDLAEAITRMQDSLKISIARLRRRRKS